MNGITLVLRSFIAVVTLLAAAVTGASSGVPPTPTQWLLLGILAVLVLHE